MSDPPLTVWIIARHDPSADPEPVAAVTDKNLACQALSDLGPEHTVLYEVPLLTADSGHTIVAWWRCTATVTATTTAIGTPTRMPGAAHMLHAGQVLHCTEHVVIDTEASQLEQAVNGTRVHYIDTFATNPTRARALADERAHQLHEA